MLSSLWAFAVCSIGVSLWAQMEGKLFTFTDKETKAKWKNVAWLPPPRPPTPPNSPTPHCHRERHTKSTLSSCSITPSECFLSQCSGQSFKHSLGWEILLKILQFCSLLSFRPCFYFYTVNGLGVRHSHNFDVYWKNQAMYIKVPNKLYFILIF